MAKKRRRKKSSKKSIHVRGQIIRIQAKKRKKLFIGPRKPRGLAKKAVASVENSIEKGVKSILKFPYKAKRTIVKAASGTLTYGKKMNLRPKRKRKDHRPDFFD